MWPITDDDTDDDRCWTDELHRLGLLHGSDGITGSWAKRARRSGGAGLKPSVGGSLWIESVGVSPPSS
jgi:hypothetical protein